MKLIRVLVMVSLLALPMFAQTITVRGLVTDESGAIVPGAKVTVTGPDGASKTTVAANDGSYSFNLYGTTIYGGPANAGVVYKVDSTGQEPCSTVLLEARTEQTPTPA
jgi:uncharacterized repeat protein (TIGR03803 family)